MSLQQVLSQTQMIKTWEMAKTGETAGILFPAYYW